MVMYSVLKGKRKTTFKPSFHQSLNEPLFSLGLNQEWPKVELDKMGVALENVFLAQVDSSGDLFLDLFDDAVQIPQPKIKELL